MKAMICSLICLVISLQSLINGSALALSQEELSPEALQELMQQWRPLEVTGDAIAWSVFAQTKEIEECVDDAEGFRSCRLKPDYGEQVQALDGKQVTLMGYMFPLEDSEKQRNFLLGPYPLSCPFHYHIGPSQVIEVLALSPIAFSYDPITVKGILRVRYNTETAIFYYLEEAK